MSFCTIITALAHDLGEHFVHYFQEASVEKQLLEGGKL